MRLRGFGPKVTSTERGFGVRKILRVLKQRGQGLVEYALILVLIAIVVLLILTFVGQQVNSTFSTIGSAMK
jgi:pilus assembly protein Flp/PilA